MPYILLCKSTGATSELMTKQISIGSRGSDLALWQARAVASLLPIPAEIKIIKTSGDVMLGVALQGRLEKGFFTKEIEEHLIAGHIDLAVHSLKDLPTEQPPSLCEAAYLERAAVSDLLLIRPDWYDPNSRFPLRANCKVGATSLRRQAMLRTFAPDVQAHLLRGNIPTRIQKCKNGEYGAIIIARAGVERLAADLKPLIALELNPRIWLPAPAQGAICVQARQDDAHILKLLEQADHAPTRQAIQIERRLLSRFEGGCHTAFAALALPDGEMWQILIGIDNAPNGWQQTTGSGSFEQCMALQPKDISGFATPTLDDGAELCRVCQ
jgi:hydroxymethylbilane synthase